MTQSLKKLFRFFFLSQVVFAAVLSLEKEVYHLDIDSENHKVPTYLYSQCTTVSVPSLELGPTHRPPPLQQASVPSPPETKGEGHICLWARGWTSPNSDGWRECLVLSLLCGQNCSDEFLSQKIPFLGATISNLTSSRQTKENPHDLLPSSCT